MRSVLSTDKSILLNDQPLSKYGDANNEVWNITMPSGGWNGRPERIILNNSIDLIHKDNVYEAYGTNNVAIRVDIDSVYKDSKCGVDWIAFNYDFRIIPQNLVSPIGDYNITYPATGFYNDQNIYLVVKYGPDSMPYKYSETVAIFGPGNWGPAGRRDYSGFTTESQTEQLGRISWWVVTESDESPIRLTYNFSDRYGQGFSGSKSTSWYSFNGIDSGIHLCALTLAGFSPTSTSGLVGSTSREISLSNSKRIY